MSVKVGEKMYAAIPPLVARALELSEDFPFASFGSTKEHPQLVVRKLQREIGRAKQARVNG